MPEKGLSLTSKPFHSNAYLPLSELKENADELCKSKVPEPAAPLVEADELAVIAVFHGDLESLSGPPLVIFRVPRPSLPME